MTGDNMQLLTNMIDKIKKYDDFSIEASIIYYVAKKASIEFSYEDGLEIYKGQEDENILSLFDSAGFPLQVEFIVEFFEALLDKDNVNENGIVFTPEYIANYIFEMATKNYDFTKVPTVIDPGCGCGIFLAVAASHLRKKTDLSYVQIFKNCIYGIELDPDNARRCKIVLHLLPLIYGESNQGIVVNIVCGDSLKCNWADQFQIKGFNFIIGNPPYVNPHDMAKPTVDYLKKAFVTTRSGVFNIFYAFIEQAYNYLLNDAILSYIVPNNFLTIKSAVDLRKFIIDRECLRLVLDFSDNMVFKPVRTYNCIIQLTKSANKNFDYCVLENCTNIEEKIKNVQFDTMPIDKLDVNGWKLVDKKTHLNISRIESQFISIGDFIRTGIATLRDNIYTVERDSSGYYKNIDEKRYDIEENLVKHLYKIPDLKDAADLSSICRYIIFPYQKGEKGFEIIPENTLKTSYPLAYKYLLSQKKNLDGRDKGKPNPAAWYAYGRTQGLNNYGAKLLFPTFAKTPRFTLVNDEYALFCNGYAIFQNDYLDLEILQKILNSEIMHYYITNTSYAIEGGYYCYQKKYIKNFSLPLFTENEKNKIIGMTNEELDIFLIEKYGLDI